VRRKADRLARRPSGGARQHPRQAGDSAGTRQWDLSYSRAESAAAAGLRGPEARRHQGQQARQHVDPRRRRGVPRDPALCRPGRWYHTLAAESYAAVKVGKYADQDNFIPFILETGGRVNKAARDWLDALTAPEPGEQVPSQEWNPQTRTTTETVLREAMQALVRMQAHMLARIVVEIRAADIAVELEPQP
jgi:hypothetical protein